MVMPQCVGGSWLASLSAYPEHLRRPAVRQTLRTAFVFRIVVIGLCLTFNTLRISHDYEWINGMSKYASE